MLVFENKGEIDIRGATIFGTSVKKSSTAIGYFGTGLKYAISILLREGGKISIYSGQTMYSFRLQEIDIRGEKFQQVVLSPFDGEDIELGYTTEVGKTWELWKAYRELYCNTVDEGGTVYQTDKKPRGKIGVTRVVVEGLDEVHEKSDEFILRSEALFELGEVDIHPLGANGRGAIFYRGVRVYEPKKPMSYSYNLKGWHSLTEDRTLNYWWTADQAIMRSIIKAQVSEPIITVVTAPESSYEGGFDFSSIEGEEPGEIFLGVMGAYGRAQANQSVYGFYSTYALAHLDNIPRMPLSAGQKLILQEAKEILRLMGFEELYSVVVTDYLGNNELSNAKNNTIYLNPVVFSKTVEEVADIVFDNYIQLKHDSNSRGVLIKMLREKCQELSSLGLISPKDDIDPTRGTTFDINEE